jgi:hypothetical protein
MYYAADGNYGNADGLVIVDSDELSQEAFDFLDNASDYHRSTIALQLLNGITLDKIRELYGD